ncbi:MAG TPA: cupin domain-containing protein [Candidatus Methanomethylia archaeon]|nr:cupin domain-containing protein [Candidatus Methanomethylicia archaeon]
MAKYVVSIDETRTFVPPGHVKCTTRALLEEANVGCKNFSMFRSEFDVGGIAEPHTHPFEQAYYVLRGEGIITIGDQEFKVKEGDSVYCPPNISHAVKNTGNEPLWLLVVNAPPK